MIDAPPVHGGMYGPYATLQAEHNLPVICEEICYFDFRGGFFSLSQLFTVLIFPLPHSHVLSVQALVGFLCTSGLSFLFCFLFFSDVGGLIFWGCLLVTTNEGPQGFVLFPLP